MHLGEATRQIIVPPGEKSASRRALNEKDSLRKLVDNNYLKVAYPMLRKFSHPVTTFLSCLIQLEIFNEEVKRVDSDGYFMIKREYIQKRIGLTRKQQGVICKELIERGLIKCKRKNEQGRIGWVRLNHSIINLVLENCSFDDTDP